MAADIFAKIGDIKGEAKDDKHKGEIDVLSWSWGITQTGAGHVGGGLGAGKISVHDMAVTKYVDTASPDLMLACASGKQSDEAKLTDRKAGENPLEYLIPTMNAVIVTSVQHGGSG